MTVLGGNVISLDKSVEISGDTSGVAMNGSREKICQNVNWDMIDRIISGQMALNRCKIEIGSIGQCVGHGDAKCGLPVFLLDF